MMTRARTMGMTILRFMGESLFSLLEEQWCYGLGNLKITWHEVRDCGSTRCNSGPDDVEGRIHARFQGIVAIKGPDKKGAEDGLAKDQSEFAGWNVRANFAAILADGDEFGEKGELAVLHLQRALAHSAVGHIGQKENASEIGTAGRLGGHAGAKGAKKFRHGNVGAASSFDSLLKTAELHLAVGQKNVIFAGEIVEERTFTDVSGVGDVFDGGFVEAFSCEKFERGKIEAFADFGGTSLAAEGRIGI